LAPITYHVQGPRPRQTIAEFTAKMKILDRLACPTEADRAFFDKHMQLASDQGLTYRECLEYVIRMRHGGAD
jgi:hypothetical protein